MLLPTLVKIMLQMHYMCYFTCAIFGLIRIKKVKVENVENAFNPISNCTEKHLQKR